MKVTIEQINLLDRDAFTQLLGGIFEHSSWVVDQTWPRRPFDSVIQLHAAMMNTVRNAPFSAALSLIRAHPDLATQMKISEISAIEQQEVGLDRLSQEEYALFEDLNLRYKERFEYPFIMAVRGQNKHTILEAMRIRVENSPTREWEQALLEIERITGFRLSDLVEDSVRGLKYGGTN